MRLICLKPHHIENLIFHHLTGFKQMEKSKRTPDCKRTYRSLVKNPHKRIQIKRGKDLICRSQGDLSCSSKGDDCALTGSRDSLFLESFGWNYGDIRTVKEILEEGERFYKETGYYTPLARINQSNNI